MGLLATLVMEKRVGKKWANLGDLLRGDAHGQLSFRTIPHNLLYVAHLLGAFNTMDPGHAPDTLSDDLRIAGKHRGVPKDAANLTRRAMGNRSHMGADATPSWVTLEEALAFNWTQKQRHRMWLNGPMAMQWWRDSSYKYLPPKHQDYYETSDYPQGLDAIIVELPAMKKLVARAREAGDNETQTRKITTWAGHLWVYVEMECPLLKLCEDFVGSVMGQLLDGGDPKERRIICSVS